MSNAGQKKACNRREEYAKCSKKGKQHFCIQSNSLSCLNSIGNNLSQIIASENYDYIKNLIAIIICFILTNQTNVFYN